jgi:methylmalonyl-CoA/ethylmalonyl-CoA epimerase
MAKRVYTDRTEVAMSASASDLRPLEKYARGIDHLAIAVRDLEQSIAWYTGVLGFRVTERNRTEGESTGMIWAALKTGALTVVLIQGTDEQSQVSRFIEHYGPGVQHVAIRVEDIDTCVEELRYAGLEFDTPVLGEAGLRQAFTRRDDGSGVMIELIQRTVEGFATQNVAQLFNTLESKGSF